MSVSVSVVIPVHNAAGHLSCCLRNLSLSEVPYLECVVVDDGSIDDSAEVARKFGATVLSTGGRKGPAYARNLGAKVAQGDILLFLDSDVCTYPDTLSRVIEAFEDDPELDAVVGSYDDSPESEDFLSQYRNLMHCFVHQGARKTACTFWSGCGAVRREVFLEHSGFDESYRRPAIEDIELGYRLFMAGRKVILDKTILVKHLKRWTFWGLLKTDIRDRGIPWTELILRDRHMPNDLNLELSQRVSVALAFLLVAFTTAAAVYWGWYFITPMLGVFFILMARYWLEPFVQPRSKSLVVLMGAVVGVIAWRAYVDRIPGLLPPLILAYLLLILRHRYAHSDKRKLRITGVILGLYILGALIYMVTYLPAHVLVFAVFILAALIVILNNQFYLFLAARQGRLFALAALPFHLLYHLYNGISFIAGLIHYSWRSVFHKKKPLLSLRPGNERN